MWTPILVAFHPLINDRRQQLSSTTQILCFKHVTSNTSVSFRRGRLRCGSFRRISAPRRVRTGIHWRKCISESHFYRNKSRSTEFRFSWATVWNNLSSAIIRNASCSLNSFKLKLHTYLFRQCQWPHNIRRRWSVLASITNVHFFTNYLLT